MHHAGKCQPETRRRTPGVLINLLGCVGWSPVGSSRPLPARASASPVTKPSRGPSATASDGAEVCWTSAPACLLSLRTLPYPATDLPYTPYSLPYTRRTPTAVLPPYTKPERSPTARPSVHRHGAGTDRCTPPYTDGCTTRGTPITLRTPTAVLPVVHRTSPYTNGCSTRGTPMDYRWTDAGVHRSYRLGQRTAVGQSVQFGTIRRPGSQCHSVQIGPETR